tara:strand:- start:119 stop:508 length:390 start_codon:yes stop_codon:yes gene_type:complete
MSREIVIAIDFGGECIAARWAVGEQHVGELRWDVPVRAPGEPPFWATEDGHALILETFAMTHFPNVDRLVLTLPAGDVDAHRAPLEQRYTGLHDVRNTECRSQRLRVRVRRVCVEPQSPASPATANAPA